MGDLQRKLAGAETQNMSRNQGGEGAKQAQGLATKEGLRGQPRGVRHGRLRSEKEMEQGHGIWIIGYNEKSVGDSGGLLNGGT